MLFVRSRLAPAAALLAWALVAGPAERGLAHDATYPIAADKVKIDTKGSKSARKFTFKASGESVIRIANHDPATDGASFTVSGVGGKRDGSSGLIRLPAKFWRTIEDENEDLAGYVYEDKKGKRAGVTKVVLKNSKLQIKAKGAKWPWKPAGKHDVVWVVFFLEDEQYCAAFTPEGDGADVRQNRKGMYQASGSLRPGACPEQLCGNAIVELGEACDDGNLDETDGCNNDCSIGECIGEAYDTTYDAIQNVVFDSKVYGCTNDACHDAVDPQGDLDLTAGSSYANLVDVSASQGDLLRVKRSEPDLSFLYEKLLAKVDDEVETDGSPMPVGAPKLSEPHLRGLREWIRGGAPEDKVVEGTQADFGTCLPEPDPLKIPPVPPPAAGLGVQLQQPPRPLPANGESEICMSVYFDYTGLVPDEAKIPCPSRYAQKSICSAAPDVLCDGDDDCGPGQGTCIDRSVLNEGNECFAVKRLEILQDPQSHHSIQLVYAGSYGLDHEGWGEWQYHFDDTSNPLHGQPCDPTDIDPALGFNPGCATVQQESVACIGYGPPDLSNFTTFFGEDAGAINLNIAQEPIKDVTFPEGVYEVMPLKSAFTWNSHAFNLTSKDSTLSQYMNFHFATQDVQDHPIENIFDAGSIFVQGVPPFETREYCRTYTVPRGGSLFRLTSHTHRLGTLFRIWEPPNEPCAPVCDDLAHPLCSFFGASPRPECTGPRDDAPLYYSTQYSDPVQMYFDPPVVHDEEDAADRTYLYCAVFDNGSTPTSPRVKRQSTSFPPPNFDLGGGIVVKLGGPCADSERYCMEGPNQGELCDPSVTGLPEEVFCEKKPGKANGVCDACPGQGGVTTEDEMFILMGDYFCPGEGGCEPLP
ncbi:MAG: hypothetical protein ACQGVK_18130 [Myxococcota bacterium]